MMSVGRKIEILRLVWLSVGWPLFFCACASSGGVERSPSGAIGQQELLTGLEPGRFTALSGSWDASLFLYDQDNRRLLGFRPDGRQFLELNLTASRYHLSGGPMPGFILFDPLDRTAVRYDDRGQKIWSQEIKDLDVAAVYTAASQEVVLLDADGGRLILCDGNLRRRRAWSLLGRGRPQAVAADLAGNMVVVAYQGEGRLDTYSAFGLFLGQAALDMARGTQVLAFDGQRRLWAVLRDGGLAVLNFSGDAWHQVAGCPGGFRAIAPGRSGSVLGLDSAGVKSLRLE